MKIGVISLGCDKNRVDAEKMLARIKLGGHKIVSDPEEADVLIVNTCAFIDSAKEESIDEILFAIDWKKERPKKRKIIVSGCLSQRYSDSLNSEFPEVDALLGVADYDGILDFLNKIGGGEKVLSTNCGDGFFSGRVLTTPYHYAYLKIADGCNNHCTYCAIPSIRGKYRSEKLENLLDEARALSDDGVKELILVAQDVTRYGVDFDGKPHLTELVRELEKLDFEWIRLLYLEPEMVDDELIAFVKNEPKVVKYMDVPFQHIDSGVLKLMNRHTDENAVREITRKIKAAGIALRSTFICGFPGETEEAHEKLFDFIKNSDIDYAGFFPYSREENTAADKLGGHIDEEIRKRRADRLSALQAELMAERAKKYVGTKLDVIFDGIDYDRQTFLGRHAGQAPDIDSVVYFSSDEEVFEGEIYPVEITGTDGVDLIGKVVK